MNILFLALEEISTIKKGGIYNNLLEKFDKEGHKLYIVSAVERRNKMKTTITNEDDVTFLRVRTLNIRKANFIEKGVGTFLLEFQFEKAINRYFSDTVFDLIIYSTPPITFARPIKRIKNRDNAKTYLLLKDIFPQNAVDIGLISKSGLVYKIARKKEKKLYEISDYIGCMSPANVLYLLSNNHEIDPASVEVCPNSIKLQGLPRENKFNIKQEFGIPEESVVFIYGGSLGKPQGLDFLLNVLESNKDKKDRFFLIVGAGTEYNKVLQWFEKNKPNNAQLFSLLPKDKYDELVLSCDVGLIFLDPRFTIPNYPSRLLSYMKNKMPVLMATDVNTDIGYIAEENGYGLWCENGDLKAFNTLVDKLTVDYSLRTKMGEKGYKFLEENYTVDKSYEIIMKHFKK